MSEAASDTKRAAKDAVNSSYEKRDEYRTEVRERLAKLDAELAELGRDTKAGTQKVRVDALAAAREARQAAGRAADKLGNATRRHLGRPEARHERRARCGGASGAGVAARREADGWNRRTELSRLAPTESGRGRIAMRGPALLTSPIVANPGEP